jgi:hypothetical protein
VRQGVQRLRAEDVRRDGETPADRPVMSVTPSEWATFPGDAEWKLVMLRTHRVVLREQ